MAADTAINSHDPLATWDWARNFLTQAASGSESGAIGAGAKHRWQSLDALRALLVEVTNVVNNLTTTVPGKVLDARQGKVLADTIQAEIAKYAQPNGIATLGSDGKVPASQIPSLALVDVFPVESEAAMLASGAEQGDMAIRSDTSQVFILSASPASTLENWIELSALKALVDAAIAEVKGDGWDGQTLVGLDTKIDTNRLYSDSQYLALKAQADAQALEIQASRAELYNGYKILQFDSTDIIGKGTKADYSAIDVSANVVDGKLSMEQKGLTITNLVDGADIADSGTVSFNTVNGDKYFDTLNETIITGDGTEMSATNSSGATANMAIYHLNALGLDHITDTDILAKLLPYVDGTQNVGKMGVQILDADDAVTQTIFLPAIGNSLPNGVADSVKTTVDGWEHTKRVQEYTLQSTDINELVNWTSIQGVRIPKANIVGATAWVNGIEGKVSVVGFSEVTAAGLFASTTPYVFATSSTLLALTFPTSTYATLAAAQAALAGTLIRYELATPVTTHYDLPLPTSGKTIHRFAGEEKIALYGTGLTFTENVLSVLSAVKFVAGEMTDITSVATITTNTVTFSGVSATDVVYVKVEHDVDRPLGVLEHTPAVSNTASRLAALEAAVFGG